jgi:SMC interacting uncharacterized protein involved in chromosome segregation
MDRPEVCNCEQALELQEQVKQLEDQVNTLNYILQKARTELSEAERVRDSWRRLYSLREV